MTIVQLKSQLELKLKLELEHPEDVNDGGGTQLVVVHPCRALFVAENSEFRSPYNRQSGLYHSVCGFSGSPAQLSWQASATVARAACRPGK